MKVYVESKLITYCVLNFNTRIKNQGSNDFFWKVSEIDFSKSWTDEELYQEFGLTEEEINEVETWCKENADKLPNKNNPLNEY